MNNINTVHISSQGKGGVGKSLVASLVCQYLQDAGEAVTAFDTDPTNATLTQFAALDATHIDVTHGTEVDLSKFHHLVECIATGAGPFVVDTGATIFLSFWNYVGQTGLIRFLEEEHGKKVIVHVPIMGGQELPETLKGFQAMALMLPPSSIVVWLNSFHGPVEVDGKTFPEFQVAKGNCDRVLGLVRLGDERGTVCGKAMSKMCTNYQTFGEAMAKSELMERHLLHSIRKGIWEQLKPIL